MNMTEYLTAEQDKWHRRYNDALIEIAKLSKENEDYKLAIHTLIWERDMAIKEVNKFMNDEGFNCHICGRTNCKRCINPIWRGVRR